MFEFLIGSIYTIIILIIGAVIGYLIGAKEIDKKIITFKEHMSAPKEIKESGPIKSIPMREQKAADDKEQNRMKELIGG